MQQFGEGDDALRDADPLEQHLMVGRLVGPLQNLLERIEQAEDVARRQGRGSLGLGLLATAREDVAPQRGAATQVVGDLLVLLVFQQAPNQFRPGIDLFRLFIAVVITAGGQQCLRLHVRQGRSHHQVLTGNVDVQRLHQIQVRQVLLGDEADRNVEDVELVLANQMQQQIERTLEDVELDAVHIVVVRAAFISVLPKPRRSNRRPLRSAVGIPGGDWARLASAGMLLDSHQLETVSHKPGRTFGARRAAANCPPTRAAARAASHWQHRDEATRTEATYFQ